MNDLNQKACRDLSAEGGDQQDDHVNGSQSSCAKGSNNENEVLFNVVDSMSTLTENNFPEFLLDESKIIDGEPFFVETSHPAASSDSTGRDAIWCKVVEEVAILRKKNIFSTLSSSTTISNDSSSAAAPGKELGIQHIVESEKDTRLSSHIFSILDKALSLPLTRSFLDRRFARAQLIVLGMESHGKSSLLERLLKIVLFPKGKGRCTTAILRAQLRRGPAALATISIRNRSTQVETHVETDLPIVGLDTAVRRLMDKIASEIENRLIAVEHEVLIKLTKEDLPNLDLVDLPGIVALNNSENKQNLAEATYELADNLVKEEKNHSILLLVVDVSTPVNLSRAAELVRLQEVEQQTIGVYTKVDMLQTENEDDSLTQILTWKLEDKSLLKTNGWLVCANRLPPEELIAATKNKTEMSTEDYRFALTATYEEYLFHDKDGHCSGLSAKMKESQTGMVAIRSRVQILFEDFLLGAWVPGYMNSLKKELRLLYADYATLGLPVVNPKDQNLEKQQSLLQELLVQAAEHASEFIYWNYNTSIFKPWRVDRIQNLVRNEVKVAIDHYISLFDLTHDRDFNDPIVAKVWTCMNDYRQFIAETEHLWEERYLFKHFADIERDGQVVATEKEQLAIAHYFQDCKDSSPQEALLLPTLKASTNHLMALIDSLLNLWQPDHLIEAIVSFLDKKGTKIVDTSEYIFKDFEFGLFFNLFQRFPLVKDYWRQQAASMWDEAKTDILTSLLSFVDSFTNQTFSDPSTCLLHQLYFRCSPPLTVNKHQCMLILRWSKRGKALAHNIVTRYLDLMRIMITRFMSSALLNIPEDCFIEEKYEANTGSRVLVLQKIVCCASLIQQLAQVMKGCPRLFFRLQHKIIFSSVDLLSDYSQHLLTMTGHENHITCVVAMSDGVTIVSGSKDKTLKFWNGNNGECIMTLPCHRCVYSVLVFDDHTIVAGVGSGSIVKIRIDISSRYASIIDKWTGHTNHVIALVSMKDGRTVLSASHDSTLKLWNINDGTCLTTLKKHSTMVLCLALIPLSPASSSSSTNHQLVVSGSWDRTLVIWDMIDMKAISILEGHLCQVYSVACPSHDKIISGSKHSDIRLWDAISGACLKVIFILGIYGPIFGLTVMSHDTVASNSSDNTITIWRVNSERKLQTLKGHSNDVTCLEVLSDGRLVSGSKDNTISIWN